MHQNRQLAAIMFTDIKGYTSLMQQDEGQAISLRQAHRKIFSKLTNQYGGKILQYFGDGTLSIFDSAIAAVECGIDMQLAFREYAGSDSNKQGIPVRIGIHSGDIIYSQEEIIGDSVNVASRIESLASAGSVFISDKVYDEIKNHHSIETLSMGLFAFKNVTKRIEIFAISNIGLVVPDPDQIDGKILKNAKKIQVLKSIWSRGQPQLVAGYFVGMWGLVQFADWTLNRYQISPYWVDILLLFFIFMLPSVLLYIWNKDRIHKGKFNWIEKVAFPGNLITAMLTISILFRGSDLGTTTQTVFYDNEHGVEESRMIIKPEFRIKLAIHNFLPEHKDSLHRWMSWGIHNGVAEDISQNGYLTLSFWHRTESLQEMIKTAQEEPCPYMLTGTYSVEGGQYQITSKLYDTHDGSLEHSHTYKGSDFFALLDTISKTTISHLGLHQSGRDRYVDLPFEQAFTSNIKAYENYSLFFLESHSRYLDRAVTLDSTFALANHVRASFLFSNSFSLLGAQEAIDQAMRFRKRLPEDFESNLRMTYFQVHNQPDKAIAILKMQLEINPHDQDIIRTLTHYLYMMERYDELLEWREKLALLNPGSDAQIKVAEGLLLNGRLEEASEIIFSILERNPQHIGALGALEFYYAITGKVDEAEEILQKITIKVPEIEPIAKEHLIAFDYIKTYQHTPESLAAYKGQYRIQDRAAKYDVNPIGNFLMGKGRSYMSAFFFIPSGPDEFLLSDDNLYEKWTFVRDSSDQVFQIIAERVVLNHPPIISVLWRQDSLIDHAVGLFSLDKKAAALDAFKTAYARHPQHFYLGEYIRHLEFVLDPQHKDDLEEMKKYTGRYGPRYIWIEDDKFYYQREGSVATQRLLPLAQDLFYFWGGYQYYMQVDVENGEVKGTVSWEYNNELKQFIRDDSDYLAYDRLKG